MSQHLLSGSLTCLGANKEGDGENKTTYNGYILVIVQIT